MVMKFFKVSFRTKRHDLTGHEIVIVAMIFGVLVIQHHTCGHEIGGFLSNLTHIEMKQAICVMIFLSNLLQKH